MTAPMVALALCLILPPGLYLSAFLVDATAGGDGRIRDRVATQTLVYLLILVGCLAFWAGVIVAATWLYEL